MLSKSSVFAEMEMWTGGVREGVESTSWSEKLNIQLHSTAFFFVLFFLFTVAKKSCLGFGFLVMCPDDDYEIRNPIGK